MNRYWFVWCAQGFECVLIRKWCPVSSNPNSSLSTLVGKLECLPVYVSQHLWRLTTKTRVVTDSGKSSPDLKQHDVK